ncbi:response regulator [Sediminicola sp. 1XM1-17]|uniref:response regulator n=1 Tax=Sediminicola sp. 1XM1-17 TaxID=3127702 RepID=UPI003078503B
MNYRTIIIDDDKVICMLINKLLDKSKLSKAMIFNQATEALQLLIDNDSELNHYLIFLDINMPVMSGWEFLDALNDKSLKSNIYVSIITSSINQTDKEKAEGYEYIFDFLIKPVKLEDIESFEQYHFLSPFHKKD